MRHTEVVPDLMGHHVDGGEAGAGVGLPRAVPHPHLPDHAAVVRGADARHRGQAHGQVTLASVTIRGPEVYT